MSWYHQLRNLFRGDALDREIREEIDFHAEAAGVRFGNRTLIQERIREADSWAVIESVVADLRYACRTLLRSPLFTVLAIASLALGTGASTALFTLADAVLFRSLPVPRPGELLLADKADAGFSYPLFQRMARELPPTASLAAMARTTSATIRLAGSTDTARYQIVSGSFFPTLEVKPAAGRLLGPTDDERPGAHPVAVASHGFWMRRLGGGWDAVGTSVVLNGATFTIVGIGERGFAGVIPGDPVDLWITAAMQHEVRYRDNAATYGSLTDTRPFLTRNTAEWLTLVLRAPHPVRDQALARMTVPFHVDRQELADIIPNDPAWTRKFLRQRLTFAPAAGGRTSSAAALRRR